MITTDMKLARMFEYLDKKAPDILTDYNNALEIVRTYPDHIELMEFVISKARLDLFAEVERDILSIIGTGGYYGK